MSRSRIAASFFLSFLLFTAPAFAQTTAASNASFKDACKAGYTYMIVPTASGVSVREAQRVDCSAKDATGTLVNRATRECSQQIGDIYWDCRKGLTEGTYKCEHKTCKNGEAISDPSTGGTGVIPGAGAQTQLPAVLIQETGTGPLPPLSRQSILDALREAPPNMGQESVYRSTAADNFERFMLQAGLAPGGLVPGTGNAETSTFFSQTPAANDAVRLQGGTLEGVSATRVETSGERGGIPGSNTFTPTQVAQFSEGRPITWEDRVSTFLGCAVGYFFGGCDSAEAHAPDSEVKRQNITVLSVKQNNGDTIAPQFFSQSPESEERRLTLPSPAARNPDLPVDTTDAPKGGSAPAQVTLPAAPSSADLDTMTPAQLKAIEADLSAQRSAQLAEDEARRKAAIPKSPTTLQNNIIAGLFKAISGGGTEDLKTAWNEAALTQSIAERAVPVTPVEVAELSPIPGAELRTASAPASAQPGTDPDAPQPAAERSAADSSRAQIEKQREITERVIAQKREEIEAARIDLQARTDAFITSTRALGYDDIKLGAAWPVYEQWWKEYEDRVDAFAAKVDAYRSGDKDVVQQVDAAARTLAGGTSEGLTRTIDTIRRNGNDIWNQTPSFWEDPVSATLGGATRFAEQTITNSLEASRNLLEQTGQLGETLGFSSPERAVGRVFDPVGANEQLAKDAALVGGTTVAPWAAGRVAGLFERSAWTALPRSVTSDVRLIMEDSAGFPAAAARSSAEAAIEPVAPGALPSVSADAAAIARTEAAANEIRALSGGRPGAPASGGNPYSALDDAVAEARAAASPKMPGAANIEPAGASPASARYAALDDVVANAPAGAAQPNAPVQASGAAEAQSGVASAAEKAAESGALRIPAGTRTTLDESVWNQTNGSWTGGAAITGGILFLGFCPSSEPLPAEPVAVEIVPLSKENVALLFPELDKPRQPSAPAEASMPVNVVVEEAPVLAQPSSVPRAELEAAAPAERPSIVQTPTAAAPPVLTAPPLPNEADLVVPPGKTDAFPQRGTPEFEKYFDEQQKKVEAEIEEQRKKGQEAFEAWDAAQRQRTKEIYEKITQLEKEIAEKNLPPPIIVPPDAPQNTSPGAQGVGPLSSDDIARGLLPNPASEGSRRKDLEINFEFGSARLLNDGREQVASLAQVMSRDEFRNSTFNIVGHTDTVGTAESNLILSRARAQAIVDILHRDYGIPLEQMKATGAGQWVLKVPILGNVPANRRVEIVVTPRR